MKETKELLTYLGEVVSLLKQIKQTLANRNKTTKMKALTSICNVYLDRADATLKYAKAGGYNEFNSFVVEEIFGPVIEYLASEAIK